MTDTDFITPESFGGKLDVANGCVTVTPDDDAYITYPGAVPRFNGRNVICRAFRVFTTAGNVTVETPDGALVTYHAVTAGTVIEQKFKRIMATGTTAVGIEAIY